MSTKSTDTYIQSHLNQFIISSCDKVLAITCDVKAIDRACFRTLELSDEWAIDILPVTDLSVSAACDYLAFIRMIGDSLEESVGKHDLISNKSPTTRKFWRYIPNFSYDSSARKWMYITVCLLCGPSLIPSHISRADHTLPTHSESAWWNTAQSPLQWCHAVCGHQGGRPSPTIDKEGWKKVCMFAKPWLWG